MFEKKIEKKEKKITKDKKRKKDINDSTKFLMSMGRPKELSSL